MAAEVIEIWIRDEYEKGRSVSKSYESGMGSDADNVESKNDNFQQRAGAYDTIIVDCEPAGSHNTGEDCDQRGKEEFYLPVSVSLQCGGYYRKSCLSGKSDGGIFQ